MPVTGCDCHGMSLCPQPCTSTQGPTGRPRISGSTLPDMKRSQPFGSTSALSDEETKPQWVALCSELPSDSMFRDQNPDSPPSAHSHFLFNNKQ